MNPYESKELLGQYLLFHYGSPEEILPYDDGPGAALHFPARTVTETIPHIPTGQADFHVRRALDLGCAVGRAAFELARHCEEVVAIDYSRAFIKAANTLKDEGSITYRRRDEGRHTTKLTATRPAGIDAKRVVFETGNAMKLREDLRGFDLVHAANLLCRLSKPKDFLDRLPGLVTEGGHLIMTTPCTWTREFTPKRRWPKKSTLDYLQSNLSGHFELLHTHDMPFLIREHARKFQWSVAQASVWARKSGAGE